MQKEKLAIIIPTKNRAEELNRLLESILIQQVRPVQVIVVDGGDAPIEDLSEKFSGLNMDYVRSRPPSLTVQRNVGIGRVGDEATLVAFLDDDVILEEGALENMMKFWEFASIDTGGASFNNMNDAYRKPKFFEKIFFVNADTQGKMLRSGFLSKVGFVDRTMQIGWLPGYATIWKRDIFDEFMYDEWFSGYARYEDVDFSYRVGRIYKMFVVADAKVKHLNRLEDIDFSFSLGKMQIINRLYFVKKNPNLSAFLCYWACIGLFLNNIIKGLSGHSIRYVNRAKGNIAGFIEILCKRNLIRTPVNR